MKEGCSVEKTITTRRKCPKKHTIVKTIKFEGNMPSSYKFFCPICNKEYPEIEVPRPSKKADKLNWSIPEDKNELVQKYASTSNSSTRKSLKKAIINSRDPEVDQIIDKLLDKAKGQRRNRIIEVAVLRKPEKYMKEFYEIFSVNEQELREKLKSINFNSKRCIRACINLVEEMKPFPQILLSRVCANEQMQYVIRGEIEKGICPKYYLDYLSANWDIILEPWIQEKVYEQVVNEEYLDMTSCRYLDLNSRNGFQFINAIEDLAVAYGVLNANIWGIEENGLSLVNRNVLLADKFKKYTPLSDSDLADIKVFLGHITSGDSKVGQHVKVSDYYGLVSEMLTRVDNIELAEQYRRFLYEQNIKPRNIDIYLASRKSELQYNYWIAEIHNEELTQKHATSKKILTYYPEKVCDLLREVDVENNDTLRKNVQIMIESMSVEVVSIDEKVSVVHEKKEAIQKSKKKDETQSTAYFDDWSYEDTEDELFKDFIQKD